MKCQKEPDLSVGLCRHSLATNGLHMACGGFEALSCPPKPKLAKEQKP